MGTCSSGRNGTGFCICFAGWSDAQCTDCAPGYWGSNCTACTCNLDGGVCVDGYFGTGDCIRNSNYHGKKREERVTPQDAPRFHLYNVLADEAVTEVYDSALKTSEAGSADVAIIPYSGIDSSSCIAVTLDSPFFSTREWVLAPYTCWDIYNDETVPEEYGPNVGYGSYGEGYALSEVFIPTAHYQGFAPQIEQPSTPVTVEEQFIFTYAVAGLRHHVLWNEDDDELVVSLDLTQSIPYFALCFLNISGTRELFPWVPQEVINSINCDSLPFLGFEGAYFTDAIPYAATLYVPPDGATPEDIQHASDGAYWTWNATDITDMFEVFNEMFEWSFGSWTDENFFSSPGAFGTSIDLHITTIQELTSAAYYFLAGDQLTAAVDVYFAVRVFIYPINSVIYVRVRNVADFDQMGGMPFQVSVSYDGGFDWAVVPPFQSVDVPTLFQTNATVLDVPVQMRFVSQSDIQSPPFTDRLNDGTEAFPNIQNWGNLFPGPLAVKSVDYASFADAFDSFYPWGWFEAAQACASLDPGMNTDAALIANLKLADQALGNGQNTVVVSVNVTQLQLVFETIIANEFFIDTLALFCPFAVVPLTWKDFQDDPRAAVPGGESVNVLGQYGLPFEYRPFVLVEQVYTWNASDFLDTYYYYDTDEATVMYIDWSEEYNYYGGYDNIFDTTRAKVYNTWTVESIVNVRFDTGPMNCSQVINDMLASVRAHQDALLQICQGEYSSSTATTCGFLSDLVNSGDLTRLPVRVPEGTVCPQMLLSPMLDTLTTTYGYFYATIDTWSTTPGNGSLYLAIAIDDYDPQLFCAAVQRYGVAYTSDHLSFPFALIGYMAPDALTNRREQHILEIGLAPAAGNIRDYLGNLGADAPCFGIANTNTSGLMVGSLPAASPNQLYGAAATVSYVYATPVMGIAPGVLDQLVWLGDEPTPLGVYIADLRDATGNGVSFCHYVALSDLITSYGTQLDVYTDLKMGGCLLFDCMQCLHGSCTGLACACDDGWKGTYCDIAMPPNQLADFAVYQNFFDSNGLVGLYDTATVAGHAPGDVYFSVSPGAASPYNGYCTEAAIQMDSETYSTYNLTNAIEHAWWLFDYLNSSFTAGYGDTYGEPVETETFTHVSHFKSIVPYRYPDEAPDGYMAEDPSIATMPLTTMRHHVLYNSGEVNWSPFIPAFETDSLIVELDLAFAMPALSLCALDSEIQPSDYPWIHPAVLSAINCTTFNNPMFDMLVDTVAYKGTLYEVTDWDWNGGGYTYDSYATAAWSHYNATDITDWLDLIQIVTPLPFIDLDPHDTGPLPLVMPIPFGVNITGISYVMSIIADEILQLDFERPLAFDFYFATRIWWAPFNHVVTFRVRFFSWGWWMPGMPFNVEISYDGGFTFMATPSAQSTIDVTPFLQGNQAIDIVLQTQFVVSQALQTSTFEDRLPNGTTAFADTANFVNKFPGPLAIKVLDQNTYGDIRSSLGLSSSRQAEIELCWSLAEAMRSDDAVLSNLVVAPEDVGHGRAAVLMTLEPYRVRKAFEAWLYPEFGGDELTIRCDYVVTPLTEEDFQEAADGSVRVPGTVGLPFAFRPFIVVTVELVWDYTIFTDLYYNNYGDDPATLTSLHTHLSPPVDPGINIFNTTAHTISDTYAVLYLEDIRLATGPLDCTDVVNNMINSVIAHRAALSQACSFGRRSDQGIACNDLYNMLNYVDGLSSLPVILEPCAVCPQLIVSPGLTTATTTFGYMFDASEGFGTTPSLVSFGMIVAVDQYDPALFCGYLQRYDTFSTPLNFPFVISACEDPSCLEEPQYLKTLTFFIEPVNLEIFEYFASLDDAPCFGPWNWGFMGYSVGPGYYGDVIGNFMRIYNSNSSGIVPGSMPPTSVNQAYSASVDVSYAYGIPVTGVSTGILNRMVWMINDERWEITDELYTATGRALDTCERLVLYTVFAEAGDVYAVAQVNRTCDFFVPCGCSSHGECVNDACVCDFGWSGSACDVVLPRFEIDMIDGPGGAGAFGAAVASFENVLVITAVDSQQLFLYNCQTLPCTYATSYTYTGGAHAFGTSVAIIGDDWGYMVAVGAPLANGGNGTVVVYDCDLSSSWTCAKRTLINSTATYINNLNHTAPLGVVGFGQSVSLTTMTSSEFTGAVVSIGFARLEGDRQGGFETRLCAAGHPTCANVTGGHLPTPVSDYGLLHYSLGRTVAISNVVDVPNTYVEVRAGMENTEEGYVTVFACSAFAALSSPECGPVTYLNVSSVDDTNMTFGASVAFLPGVYQSGLFGLVVSSLDYGGPGSGDGGLWMFQCGLALGTSGTGRPSYAAQCTRQRDTRFFLDDSSPLVNNFGAGLSYGWNLNVIGDNAGTAWSGWADANDGNFQIYEELLVPPDMVSPSAITSYQALVAWGFPSYNGNTGRVATASCGEGCQCQTGWQYNPDTSTECATCSIGYYGDTCAACDCPGHAVCNDGFSGDGGCVCPSNYGGMGCEDCAPYNWGQFCVECASCVYGTCNATISGDGTCVCEAHYTGELCDACVVGDYYSVECAPCPDCHHGVCDSGISGDGTCDCNMGFAGQHCDECAGLGFDIATNCTTCLGVNYDIEQSCTSCIGNYDPSADCTDCFAGYADETNCTTCAPNYYLGEGCTLCPMCLHGTCTEDGGCTCESGWAGDLCDACAGGYEGAMCAPSGSHQVKSTAVVLGYNTTTLAASMKFQSHVATFGTAAILGAGLLFSATLVF